jgi:hypothetical protein
MFPEPVPVKTRKVLFEPDPRRVMLEHEDVQELLRLPPAGKTTPADMVKVPAGIRM